MKAVIANTILAATILTLTACSGGNGSGPGAGISAQGVSAVSEGYYIAQQPGQRISALAIQVVSGVKTAFWLRRDFCSTSSIHNRRFVFEEAVLERTVRYVSTGKGRGQSRGCDVTSSISVPQNNGIHIYQSIEGRETSSVTMNRVSKDVFEARLLEHYDYSEQFDSQAGVCEKVLGKSCRDYGFEQVKQVMPLTCSVTVGGKTLKVQNSVAGELNPTVALGFILQESKSGVLDVRSLNGPELERYLQEANSRPATGLLGPLNAVNFVRYSYESTRGMNKIDIQAGVTSKQSSSTNQLRQLNISATLHYISQRNKVERTSGSVNCMVTNSF